MHGATIKGWVSLTEPWTAMDEYPDDHNDDDY
jgi:hypothetical protein